MQVLTLMFIWQEDEKQMQIVDSSLVNDMTTLPCDSEREVSTVVNDYLQKFEFRF